MGPVRRCPRSHSYVATVPNGITFLGNCTLPLSGCVNSRHRIAVYVCISVPCHDVDRTDSSLRLGLYFQFKHIQFKLGGYEEDCVQQRMGKPSIRNNMYHYTGTVVIKAQTSL